MKRFIPTILLLVLLVFTIMIGQKTQDIREKTNMNDTKMFGENPIIKSIYTADPAPMVYGDTLYLYTTHDEDELVNDFYTMNDWRCFFNQGYGQLGGSRCDLFAG